MNQEKVNNWLFFSQCLICHSKDIQTFGFCSPCLDDFSWIKQHCPNCYLPQQQDALCAECSSTKAHQPTFALFDYQFPIKQLISNIKYNNQPFYMTALAQLMAHQLKQSPIKFPDVLMPVPMHKKALKKRGYNQAEILCNILSRTLNIKMDNQCLIKSKASQAQMSLSLKERQKNLKGVFQAKSHNYQHIALIDDVMTTGTTLRHLSQALQQEDIKISYWTLVRTAK